MKYKLAIIIPTWNSATYIGEMLDSILSNDFDDWRCFVVDDQSTDNTIDILTVYQQRDSRIVPVLRNRIPKGAPTCRNIGFDYSDGAEYVIWFDADDVISPYCLSQRVFYMERHPELDFGVFPAKTFVNDLWDINEKTRIYGIRYGKDSLRDMLKWCLPMVGWTNIYRRSSVMSNNLLWDEQLKSMQDSDFNIMAMVKGMRYDYAWDEEARTDYFYRVDQSQKSAISSKMFDNDYLGGHLYYLNKIFSSLTGEQLHYYERDLECYTLAFAEKIRENRPMYRKFLKIPYIHQRLFLRYGLFIFGIFPKVYPFEWQKKRICTILMMNRLQKDWMERRYEWVEFMQEKVLEMIKKKNNNEQK